MARLSDRRRALIALGAAGTLFGLTVPLTKVALGWLDPAWLTVVRFALAAPVLALAAPRGTLRAALAPSVLAWGGVGYGAMVLLQNAGVERTSVGHAALVFGAVPALVALVAVVTGRGVAGATAWGGFGVALAGVLLVAGSGGDASVAGDALVLASAVCSAVFVVAQTELLPGRDPVAVTATQMAAAAIVALLVAVGAGETPAVTGVAAGHVAAVAALVVAGTLLPFALFAFGQARVPAELAGAFVNVEPLVGAAVAVVAFHDPFGPLQAVGAAAILAGIALSSADGRTRRRRGRLEAAPA
jgi:drug/metabolite transporter (DMT)-like permease